MSGDGLESERWESVRRIQDRYVCSRCGKFTWVPAGQAATQCCRWSLMIRVDEGQKIALAALDQYDIARLENSIRHFGKRIEALEREAKAAARAVVAFSEELRRSNELLDRLAELEFEENGGPGEDDRTIAFVEKDVIRELVEGAQRRRDAKYGR